MGEEEPDQNQTGTGLEPDWNRTRIRPKLDLLQQYCLYSTVYCNIESNSVMKLHSLQENTMIFSKD